MHETSHQQAKRLNAIYRFVREHGFRAEISDVVRVWIPYTHETLGDGFDVETLRTMSEARYALGY